MATIIMTDYPLLKYLILGVMAMLVLTQRDWMKPLIFVNYSLFLVKVQKHKQSKNLNDE
jgi:hypothetical protein